MAFGDHATLLSALTGADENPLTEGGNFAKVNTDSGSNMQRLGGGATGTEVPPNFGDSHVYWTPEVFGPDVECYITVNAAFRAIDLTARVSTPGGPSTWEGYWLQIEGVAWSLFQTIDGASSLLATANQAVAVGAEVGLEVICETIKGYYNAGGGWAQVVSATNKRYRAPGYVAFGADQNVVRLNDFYAGTIPRTAPCPGGLLPILGAGT